MFAEILEELCRHEQALGGVRCFKNRHFKISKKIKKEEFKSNYTDFEYIYLTILGFANLFKSCEEIVQNNNGKFFNENPGVQQLERTCGMTMHGDRPGANYFLRVAPHSLLEAFDLAKQSKQNSSCIVFFQTAFDRTADPCLEGRTGRLLEYIEATKQSGDIAAGNVPPYQDVSVDLAEGSNAETIVGEYARVFANESTWRWAQDNGFKYSDAKEMRQRGECDTPAANTKRSSFSELYNAEAFTKWIISRGALVPPGGYQQWEVELDNSQWSPLDRDVNEAIEAARSSGLTQCEVAMARWKYLIDIANPSQKNLSTGKVRKLRYAAIDTKIKGKVTSDELNTVVATLVNLQTMPAKPPKLDEASPQPDAFCLEAGVKDPSATDNVAALQNDKVEPGAMPGQASVTDPDAQESQG